MNKMSKRSFWNGIMAACFAACLSLVVTPSANATVNYVALGDSYAAGFGADTNQYQGEHMSQYDPTTIIPGQNECYRAFNNAYAPRIAAANGFMLNFAACQGAVTADILTNSQFPGQAPQINNVTADTNLVSLQIGGNDAKFSEIVLCIVSSECTASSPAYVEAMNVLQTQLPGRLDAVYAAIESRAPSAQILTIDYAPILPQTANHRGLCKPYMSAAELQLAQNFHSALNQTIKAAADRAGATFVKTNYVGSPFLGNDWIGLSKNACSASAGSIAWSLRFLANGTNVGFHPTAYGQQFYAQIINTYL